MLLITAALRQEMSEFKSHLDLALRFHVGPFCFYKGRLAPHPEEIGVLLTSVAPERKPLAEVIQYLHQQFGIERAILSGFAGALWPGLVAGQLVLASKFIAADEADIPSDDPLFHQLRSQLQELTLLYTEGPCVTVKEPVATCRDKELLGKHTQAVMVDMESFDLACIFHAARIPYVGLRSIFDPMELELSPLLSGLVDAQGRFCKGKGVKLLTEPKEILKLPLFAKNAARARSSLARCLLHII